MVQHQYVGEQVRSEIYLWLRLLHQVRLFTSRIQLEFRVRDAMPSSRQRVRPRDAIRERRRRSHEFYAVRRRGVWRLVPGKRMRRDAHLLGLVHPSDDLHAVRLRHSALPLVYHFS